MKQRVLFPYVMLIFALALFVSCAQVREKPDVVQESEADDTVIPPEPDTGDPDQDHAVIPEPADRLLKPTAIVALAYPATKEKRRATGHMMRQMCFAPARLPTIRKS